MEYISIIDIIELTVEVSIDNLAENRRHLTIAHSRKGDH